MLPFSRHSCCQKLGIPNCQKFGIVAYRLHALIASYGNPIHEESSSPLDGLRGLWAPKILPDVEEPQELSEILEWKGQLHSIRGRTVYTFEYVNFDKMVSNLRDSLKTVLQPEQILKLSCASSPSISFRRDGSIELILAVGGFLKLDHAFDQSIVAAEFDINFVDNFKNTLFTIPKAQFEFPAKVSNGVGLFTQYVHFVFPRNHPAYGNLKAINESKLYAPPVIKTIAVRFEDGLIVKHRN